MPRDPHDDLAKRQWVEGAVARLEALRQAVGPLRGALISGPRTAPGQQGPLTFPVMEAVVSVTRWLEARAPSGLGKAEAELGATAGVYRNVAVAFSSLADSELEQHAARFAACVKLLEQGDHHVELFFSILEKKRLGPSS
jgi:hypothetical protein